MAESHGEAKGQKAGAHTEAEGGHHGGAFPPFDSSTYASQLVSLAIAFVALYLIVSRIALPRVGGTIDARQNKIEGDLAEAQRIAHVGNVRRDYGRDIVTWSPEFARIYGLDPDGHMTGAEF